MTFLNRLFTLILLVSIVLTGFFVPAFADPDKKILVLYKQRDPDHQGLIKLYTDFLKQAGFNFETKDVEKLLAEKPDMDNYHGIMTIFQSSQMLGGDVYPMWLVKQMEAGRQILILGSYGAYQGLIKKPDGSFVEWNELTQTINTFFYPFGLQFYFAFTGDSSKLKLHKADKQYAQFQAPITQQQLNYYQLYKSVNSKNKIFFEVERKDMVDSRSAFNVITPFGGMILEGYALSWDKEKKQNMQRVDFPAFMKQVFNQKSPNVTTIDYKTHEELVALNPLPERDPPVTIADQKLQKDEIPRQVLMLYKKSEASHLEEAVVYNRAGVILEYLGLVPVYRAVEDGLPNKEEMQGIHAIVTWHTSHYMQDAQAYGDWLIKQIENGKKVAILENYGATFDAKTQQKVDNQTAVFAALGIEYVDRPIRREEHIPKVRIFDKSMLEYEHAFLPENITYEDTYPSVRPENQVFFSFNDKAYGNVDFGIITANGGVSLEQTPFYFPPHDNERLTIVNKAIAGEIQPEIAEQPTIGAWNINPYKFFSQALSLDSFPAADVTTLNGSRIFYAHIDGDGLTSISLIDKAHLAGTFIFEDILKVYADIPTTVSVITKNVERLGNKYHHPGILLSRNIFQLDNVEVATHSATHPFDWVGGDPYVTTPDDYPYKIAYREQNLLEEIWGSKLFSDNYLAPSGKKTNILFWSGATNPDQNALEIVWRAGMHNLNGGDPRFDEKNPSLANLSPYTLSYPPYRQYLTSAQNDYYYTLFLTGDWGGQKELIKHFEKTESPHRIYPMNLYYHFYSGIKHESMAALKSIYDYIRKQDSANIFTTQYVEIAEDFYRTHIGREGKGYWIENNGFLRTLRLNGLHQVDMKRSKGIIGYSHHDSQTYVHMDGRKRRLLHFTNQKPTQPYIIQSTQFIDEFSSSKDNVDFLYRGFGNTLLKIGGLHANAVYQMTFSKNDKPIIDKQLMTNKQGELTFRSHLKAPQLTYSVSLKKRVLK